jgi:hypothetical protein
VPSFARAFAAAATLYAAPPTMPEPNPPRDGEELVHRMRDRYAGRWYRTLTFTQRTTLPDGSVETWYEALQLPGRLRIDIAPLDGMNTILFRNDSIYEFRGGRLHRSAVTVHPLMVLGFDVYEAPVPETVRKLRDLGFDLSKLHESTWRGRPVYVVGAASGDTTSAQFWIDRERLYFVRSLQPSRKDSTAVEEVRFDRYVRLGGGWVETEVLFLVNGRQRMKEEYQDLRADVPLDPAIFDPSKWVPPGWVK